MNAASVIATTLCKSGKFECGQGVCAPICMSALGDPRTRGCGEAFRVHGELAEQIARDLVDAALVRMGGAA